MSDESTDQGNTGEEGGSEVTLESLAETLATISGRLDEQDETIKRISKRRAAKPAAKKDEPAPESEEDDETGKLRKELSDTQTKLSRITARTRKAVAVNAANEFRAIDGDAVAALLDFDSLDDPDDEDEIKSAVKQLLKDKPNLVKRVRSAGAGERGEGMKGENVDMNAVIRGAAGRGTA